MVGRTYAGLAQLFWLRKEGKAVRSHKDVSLVDYAPALKSEEGGKSAS